MLELFISAVIIASTNLFVWSKLLRKKVNFKEHKLYICIIFVILGLMGNSILSGDLLRVIVALFIVMIAVKYLYNLPFKECIILSIITQLFFIISEVFVIILVLVIMNIENNRELVEMFFGTIYANITISAVVFIIAQFPFIRRLHDKILELVKDKKVYIILIMVVLISSVATLLFSIIYYDNNLLLLSIICLVLLITFLYFIVKDINMKNNYLNIYGKYNSSLEALKSYEEILDKYKVSNHENKNQLLMIRNMLGKDNKNDVSKYIDKIVENEYKDDEKIMMETSKIPAGGLRALIYSKLVYMKNNGISFDLKVDRKIRSIELIDLKEEMILDICKITGVFLDNAIEEVKNVKEGNISIELYMLDNKLNVSIANVFEGAVDLEKIDEIKYTTKGSGHGYGLSLVKEIINKNSRLENIRMINDNVFIQILRIEM